MNKILVSVFFIGFLPFAPGTFGSLAGLILGLLLQVSGGFPLFITSTLLIFLIGWYSSINYILTKKNQHDPQEIVIDEVVGQLLSCTPISFYIWVSNSESVYSTFYNWLIAFILFRAFDIFKPWPVNWADKINSGLGVMLDDIVAGVYSALLLCAIILLIK